MGEGSLGPALWPGLLSVAVGLGLAAACGFRIFVPLLIASLAARFGHLPLTSGFEWLAGPSAMIALSTATVLEIGAYYIPWLDHALDTVATPTAVVAGMLASAAVLTNLPAPLRWAIAIVGGGGAAGLIQGSSVLLRLKSSLLTGGAGNFAVSTLELIGAVAVALLAVLAPLAAAVAVVLLVAYAIRTTGRLVFRRGPAAGG
ncbi:MAG TPA: DUF4126 domain-containing protein [Gemmatimonadales bacterium]|nr:DUF4126 domain-containing protein [Gemmatimonadales bacterium]